MPKQRFEIDADLRDSLKKVAAMGGQFRELAGDVKTAEKSASSFGSVFKGTFASGIAQSALSGIAGGVVALGGAMIKGAAELENYKTQFEVMLGSAERGNAMFKQLQDSGARTPFGTTELAAATQTMLGFGIAGENIMPNLQMLGDVAGGNAEKLKGLTLVFSQVQSAGKLTGGDLMQMINNGFNPLQEISAITGKSMAQLKGEMEKGAISSDMVTAAFQRATGEGGKFHGMMEKQSKTFDGMISTLKDTVGMMLADLGTKLLPLIKSLVDGLTRIFSDPKIMSAIQQIGELLTSLLGPILDMIIPLLQQLLPPVIQVAQALGGVLVVAIKTLSPILAIIAGLVVKLAPIFVKVGEALSGLIVALAPLLEVLPTLIEELLIPMLPLFSSLIDLVVALTPVLGLVATVLGAVTKAGIWLIGQVVTPIIDSIKFIIDNAAAAINAISSIFGGGGAVENAAMSTNKAVGYGGPGLLGNIPAQGAPAGTTTEDGTKKPPPGGGGKGGTDAAKKALDEKFKLASAEAKREEELNLASMSAVGRSEEELFQIREFYAQERLHLARKFKQDSETIAAASHEIALMRIEEEARVVKEADERTKAARQAAGDADQAAAQRMREEMRTAAQERVDAERRMSDLRIELMLSEEDRRKAIYERDLRALQEKLDRELISEEEFALARKKLGRAHAKDEEEQERQAAANRWQVADTLFANLKAVATEQSDLAKGIAIAQATMDTYRSATASYASAAQIPYIGFILGPIAAAAAIAAGMANVAAIQSARPMAEGGLLSRPVFVAGEAGTEIVAPLRDVPGMVAESVRLALGTDKPRAINKRNGPAMTATIDTNIGYGPMRRGSRDVAFKRMRGQL